MNLAGTIVEVPLERQRQEQQLKMSFKEAGKKICRMQRRHSLTLGFRQEDDDEDSALMLEEEQAPRRSFPSDQLLVRQGKALSEPLLDLGDLASIMMPPKIVKKNVGGMQPSTRKYQRQGSCGF
jgi:hypothetical protein